MEEIWKDIEGYNGNYQISNLGRVKSFKNSKTGKILKSNPNPDGYLGLYLYRGSFNNRDHVFIHRLVAETFLSNPDNLPCVNHKDRCVQNNCVDNLEWCSFSYNSTYDNARKRAAAKTVKILGFPVRCIEDDKTFISISEATRYYSADWTTIKKMCDESYCPKRGQLKGKHFEYIKEDI